MHPITADACQEEYLVSLANKTIGLEIAIFAKDGSGPENTFTEHSLPGTFLSPECGEQSFRCRNIIKLCVDQLQHIVLIPLLHGLLLLNIKYDGTTMNIAEHFLIETEVCSPSTVIEIFESVFVICTNQSTQILKLFRVEIDTTTISNTYLSTSLADIHLLDPPNLSNFVYASLDSDSNSQKIYFTTSSRLYKLTPLLNLYSAYGLVDPCSSVQSLAYYDWTLLAYCKDGTGVYFNIMEEKVTNTENFRSAGWPYLCPNPNIQLRLFIATNSYIQFGFSDTNSEEFFDIPGNSYYSGLCFGTGNSTFLAYRDSKEGVYIFNLHNSELHHLSTAPCAVPGCKPLQVIDDRYLVISEEDGITVIDKTTNFSAIITAKHADANLLTVLTRDNHCTSNPPEDVEKNSGSNSGNGKALVTIIGSVIGAIIFIILVVTLVVTVLLVHYLRSRLVL